MAKKLNSDGKQISISSSNVRLTADTPNNPLGWVALKDILNASIQKGSQFTAGSGGVQIAGTNVYDTTNSSRIALRSSGDIGISGGNYGELTIGVYRNGKFIDCIKYKKDNKLTFRPSGAPGIMGQIEAGRVIFSSSRVAVPGERSYFKLDENITLQTTGTLNLQSRACYLKNIATTGNISSIFVEEKGTGILKKVSLENLKKLLGL